MQKFQILLDEAPPPPGTNSSQAIADFLSNGAALTRSTTGYFNERPLGQQPSPMIPPLGIPPRDDDAYLFDASNPGNYQISLLPDLGLAGPESQLLMETVVTLMAYEIAFYRRQNSDDAYVLIPTMQVTNHTDTLAVALAEQRGWTVPYAPTFANLMLQSRGVWVDVRSKDDAIHHTGQFAAVAWRNLMVCQIM